VTGLPRPLFDAYAIARARKRALRSGREAPFLLSRAVDDLVERLALVRRTFARGAVHAAAGPWISRALRTAGVGEVVSSTAIEDVLSAWEAADGPVLLAREDTVPFADGAFDFACSLLTLQTVDDLPGVLVQLRRALRPDGLLVVTLVGGRTLSELREAFLVAEAELEGTARARVAPFVDVRDLGGLLQRAGFALPVVDSDPITVTYASPLALIADLRSMGAGNPLADRHRGPIRRATLARMLEVYSERFSVPGGRVRATFELLTATGWTPHESQQKPLSPGSARMRLADALATPRPKERD
jgi:NADH dehydrogenase [ubiquinone] 1 alpha subcomplex assembly factor 5